MKLQIRIPRELEIQLVGSEMKIIGPSGTTHFQGSYADYRLELEWGHIVLIPNDGQDAITAFNDSEVIERVIESVM